MKTFGRVTGLSVALFALIGEVNRFVNFLPDYALDFFIGFEDVELSSRVVFPIAIVFCAIIILSGIYCAIAYNSAEINYLRVIAAGALCVFILKPFIWIYYSYREFSEDEVNHFATELRTWWFNFQYMDIRNTIGSTIGGVILFIALILNFVLSLLSKPSGAQYGHSAPQDYQPNYSQQPVFQQPVYQQPQYVQPPQPPVQQSMIAELAELERMFESGALTKPEFTAAKKRVLGQ